MSNEDDTPDVASLRNQLRIDFLEREVHEMRNDIAALVEAWNTARGVLKFVRLVGALGVALAGIFGFIKGFGSK